MSRNHAEQAKTAQPQQADRIELTPTGQIANAVAHARTPEEVLALLEKHPQHRDPILFQVQKTHCNTATQQVIESEALAAVHATLARVGRQAWETYRAVDTAQATDAGVEPVRERVRADFDTMEDELLHAVLRLPKLDRRSPSRAALVQAVRTVKRNVGLAQAIARKKLQPDHDAETSLRSPDFSIQRFYEALEIDETNADDQLTSPR